MNKNTAVIYRPIKSKKTCMHYWVIKSASGPVSRGICRLCGAAREFKNYPTDCALGNTAFKELPGELGQREPEWDSFIEAEYTDETADTGQGSDSYKMEPDAVCTIA